MYFIEMLPCRGQEVMNYWASEASPTLGCSIEISRDIYIYYRYVCHVLKCVGGITYVHAQICLGQ